MTTPNPMKSLYKGLRELGLSRPYVRSAILPTWWDDDAALSPAGFAEAALLVSRHVGIDVNSLLQTRDLSLSNQFPCKFKRSSGTTDEELSLARSLATQVAFISASAMSAPQTAVPPALDARSHILDSGSPWVSLESLVDYCWSLGVPVLHVSGFPMGAKKPDGLAANIGGRPVIVVCKSHRQPSWLLFIIAHELGHIALGHVGTGQVLMDEKVNDEVTDIEEKEANIYAAALLTGDPQLRFVAPGRWPTADSLAEIAGREGARRQIDPGHITLNYAKSMGPTFWRVANAALAKLFPSPDAMGAIRERLAKNLDWSNMPEESAEFVARMSGLADVESKQ